MDHLNNQAAEDLRRAFAELDRALYCVWIPDGYGREAVTRVRHKLHVTVHVAADLLDGVEPLTGREP